MSLIQHSVLSSSYLILITSILMPQIPYALNTTTTSPTSTHQSTIFYPPSTIHPSSSPIIEQCNSVYISTITTTPKYPLFPPINYNQTTSINNSNTDTQYFGMRLNCPNNNNQGCYYGCFQSGSCIKSVISCNSNIGCNIHCAGYYSCASMLITSSQHTISTSSNLTIICNQQFSCNHMRINAISFTEVNIHCTAQNACNSMNITINNIHTIATLSCYVMNACDNLYFYSVFKDTMHKLIMYEYSNNVLVENIDKIHCIDNKYIFYTTNMTHGMIDKQISLYKLSCSGITQICGNHTCNMLYSTHVIDTKSTGMIMNENECYYMSINQVTDTTCDQCQVSNISSETKINTKHSNNTIYIFFLFIFFVILVSLIISFVSYLYNFHPKSFVDNARFYAPLIIGLQIINLSSDINLCIEIFNKSSFQHNIFIMLSGIGVLTFVILPYLINIILCKQIKSIIGGNIACKYYFESGYILFIFVTILTGSSWCSLLFSSSQLFSFNILNNGLTNYDLNQLLAGPYSFYFISSHTIFHNLPQIAFQSLYGLAIKQITFSTVIAICTSISTLIVFTFYYILEKQKILFYQTVQYYIQMDAVSKREFDKNNHFILQYQHKIMSKKGKKSELLKNIKTVFGNDNEHNIEIGYTALTTYGCIAHFISRVDVNDLGPRHLKEEELKHLNENDTFSIDSLLNHVPNDKNINKQIAKKYVNNLYAQNMDHITEVFRIHYGVDIHIQIIYHNTYPINDNGNIFHKKTQFIELYNTSLNINKVKSTSTMNPSIKSNKNKTTLGLSRTASNPLEIEKAAFTVDGAKTNILHVRLVESDDEFNKNDIYSPTADLSDVDEFNHDEGRIRTRKRRRRASDTLEENIDYTGLCVESPGKNGIKTSPHSFGQSMTGMNIANNPLGLNIRDNRSNVRILWRYDGWPEPCIINTFKFNQNQKGMNIKEIIQQIENNLFVNDGDDDKMEYEQLRYATNPTYIYGKRGWKETFKSSFIPFLIGQDGVNEVDIWFRTKQFIHNGIGKQLIK